MDAEGLLFYLPFEDTGEGKDFGEGAAQPRSVAVGPHSLEAFSTQLSFRFHNPDSLRTTRTAAAPHGHFGHFGCRCIQTLPRTPRRLTSDETEENGLHWGRLSGACFLFLLPATFKTILFSI